MEEAPYFPEPQDLTGHVVRANQRVFRGSYSDVYMGWYYGEPVAIKDIAVLRGSSTSSMRRKVNRERAIWAAMRHDNIAPLYGYIENDPNYGVFGAFISPWYANSDANAFFQSHRGRNLDLEARLEIWVGVIKGVNYLHQFVPTVVHGDLKPGNVLIDDHFTPKICDFGLSRIFLEEGSTGMTTTTAHTGTTRYLARELVATGSSPTTASDIHALGCLGLEFVYNELPYSQHNTSGAISFAIHIGDPPAVPPDHSEFMDFLLWGVFLQCWDLNSGCRPTATKILDTLAPFAQERKEEGSEDSNLDLVVPETMQEAHRTQISPTRTNAFLMGADVDPPQQHIVVNAQGQALTTSNLMKHNVNLLLDAAIVPIADLDIAYATFNSPMAVEIFRSETLEKQRQTIQKLAMLRDDQERHAMQLISEGKIEEAQQRVKQRRKWHGVVVGMSRLLREQIQAQQARLEQGKGSQPLAGRLRTRQRTGATGSQL